MTREETLAYIHEWLKDEYALNSKDRESLDMAIEALELVTSYEDTINKLTEAIANTQEPKTGHWIETNFETENLVHGYCSLCGWKSNYCEDDVVGMNYCPNCGAKMESEDKE